MLAKIVPILYTYGKNGQQQIYKQWDINYGYQKPVNDDMLPYQNDSKDLHTGAVSTEIMIRVIQHWVFDSLYACNHIII